MVAGGGVSSHHEFYYCCSTRSFFSTSAKEVTLSRGQYHWWWTDFTLVHLIMMDSTRSTSNKGSNNTHACLVFFLSSKLSIHACVIHHVLLKSQGSFSPSWLSLLVSRQDTTTARKYHHLQEKSLVTTHTHTHIHLPK